MLTLALGTQPHRLYPRPGFPGVLASACPAIQSPHLLTVNLGLER